MDHRGIIHVDGGDDFGDKRQFCTDYNLTLYHADNRFASIFTRCPGAKNLGSPAWSMETKTVPAGRFFLPGVARLSKPSELGQRTK